MPRYERCDTLPCLDPGNNLGSQSCSFPGILELEALAEDSLLPRSVHVAVHVSANILVPDDSQHSNIQATGSSSLMSSTIA